MIDLQQYAPVILSGLAILALGFANPECFQQRKNGRFTGYPSYMWMAFISVIVGILAVFVAARARNGGL